MPCIKPLKAAFDSQGRLTFSEKSFDRSKGESFRLPCSKCIGCRLDYARDWAIRSSHEASMHRFNSFITLTYRDDVVPAKLDYSHFQDFIKRLRERLSYGSSDRVDLSYIVAGEYGSRTQRPHWHAILFGEFPVDAIQHRTTDAGYLIWRSRFLDDVWGFNDPVQRPSEIGSVSFDSAGYVARYSAKKLVHGKDQDHDFHPIFKTSRNPAIGRRWIESNFGFVVDNGFVYHPDRPGVRLGVPRYYEKWLLANCSEEQLLCYFDKKLDVISVAEDIRREELCRWFDYNWNRDGLHTSARWEDKFRADMERKFHLLNSFTKD